jgi:endo-1,4-beta-D-glucanase Y
LCVFSDSLKAINPFVGRMPTDLHELYMTDCLMEKKKKKMVETSNNADDGIILIKYGLMVAYARKM